MTSAADIMNTSVISISPKSSIEEVIKVLAENNISGLPVVDSGNKVIGVISEKDILEYSGKLHVIPLLGLSGWISPYTDVSAIASFKEGINLISNTKVETLMSKKIVTVQENASWKEIINAMRKNEINRLPVVDNKGILVGIITRSDLLNHLAEREG